MKLNRIRGLRFVRHGVLSEAPHIKLSSSVDIPDNLLFLFGDLIDLGWENLLRMEAISKNEFAKISGGFGKGIAIPKTKLRIRQPIAFNAIIELADGTEATRLPETWKKAVLVLDENNKPTWFGHWVRDDYRKPYSKVMADYVDNGDALVPPG